MSIISKILLTLLLLVVIIIIAYLIIKSVIKSRNETEDDSEVESDGEPKVEPKVESKVEPKVESKILKVETYKKIVDVSNLAQLKEYFLWDNPRENGEDPTGGMVDYSYGMEKNSEGTIIKNINNDITWGEIKDNKTSTELISEENGLIKINLAKEVKNNLVGAPRLISRQLFRGGIFVFDVEHVPIGCGVWPALWLNGFIAAPDQYHQNEEGPTYKDDMQKLANTTLGTKELYSSHICKDKDDAIDGRHDIHLSNLAGRKIYPMEWPGGGEVDILEQTNFSPTNLVSIHGASNCQVSVALTDTTFAKLPIYGPEKNLIRSVCGAKACKSDIFDDGSDHTHRPSCPKKSVDDAGNSQIDVPDGFGEKFNENKGGVYAVHWIPKEKIYVWFYPRNLFSEKYLKRSNGPLSDNPNPNTWGVYEIIENSNKYYKTLVASYILNDKDCITDGCDLNFQAIIINITLGGGWGGTAMPKYCSVNNKSDWLDYIPKCYGADPKRANSNLQGAWDPTTGCYDGAKANAFRGINSKAMFYSEAYFLIRSIKVFQNDKIDQKVW